MSTAPDPETIFDSAVVEGNRRLDQPTLELVSTGFIAGFTIVFGIVALGIVESMFHAQFASLAKLAGALAFGSGLVFLVVGRAELFNENFFDPIVAVIDGEGWRLYRLARLWAGTFVLNLVGGLIFVAVLSVEGALPTGAPEALVRFAEATVKRPPTVEFARAFTGGSLVVLLSFLLHALEDATGRIVVTYLVGVLLGLGPFDHVIVTMLHVVFGVFLGADAGYAAVAETTAVVTAGNVVGGIGLVTLTHVTQAIGARQSSA